MLQRNIYTFLNQRALHW